MVNESLSLVHVAGQHAGARCAIQYGNDSMLYHEDGRWLRRYVMRGCLLVIDVIPCGSNLHLDQPLQIYLIGAVSQECMNSCYLIPYVRGRADHTVCHPSVHERVVSHHLDRTIYSGTTSRFQAVSIAGVKAAGKTTVYTLQTPWRCQRFTVYVVYLADNNNVLSIQKLEGLLLGLVCRWGWSHGRPGSLGGLLCWFVLHYYNLPLRVSAGQLVFMELQTLLDPQ